VNEPSADVEVPRLVPLTTTEAFARGDPYSSVTFPVIVLFCPTANRSEKINVTRKINFFIA